MTTSIWIENDLVDTTKTDRIWAENECSDHGPVLSKQVEAKEPTFVTVLYWPSSRADEKQSKQRVTLPRMSRESLGSRDLADWKLDTNAVWL